MRRLDLVRPLLAMALFPAVLLAQLPEADAEGCKDSKLIQRMRGCVIWECSAKEFDSAEIEVGRTAAGETVNKTLEGETEIIVYECPQSLSLLQIVRNVEAAMRQAGLRIAYSGKSSGETPMVTGNAGAQWISVQTSPNGNSYTQTAVKVKAMTQELQISADTLAEEIAKSGRAAVYGINFDTGKSTIKPESEQVLSEIAKLLTNNPDWKLGVEGHTDNVGSKAANQMLSQQRAAAVVAWLVSHGIDKARLSAQGVGDARPVADNSSEEGRAKNRRVELVRM
jgi:OOP family OmpA-OmpF porin